MLEIGTKATDFALKDQNGDIHHLSDYLGQKVLLYFYPKDDSGACTKQALAYSKLNDDFLKKGIKVLGVSKDSVVSHQNFVKKQQLTITILSDPDLEAIKAYDVWKEKKLYGRSYMGVVRTTYLIDEKGIIIDANDRVKAADDAAIMLNK